MNTKWVLILLLVTFGNTRDVAAQVADLADVLPGDCWVYEVKDEITGDLKSTTTGLRRTDANATLASAIWRGAGCLRGRGQAGP
jgi:hypothetical protein